MEPPAMRHLRRIIALRGYVALRLCVFAALVLGLMAGSLMDQGVGSSSLPILFWNSSDAPPEGTPPQPAAAPTLPAGLDTTDMQHYITKYGFDSPTRVQPLPGDEEHRLAAMLPYAMAATARYDARYNPHVEPEM